MIRLFLWKSSPSGKQLAYKQDCMQKLKWCLLCSAAAESFNKLMEKLLFFCLYFLSEACDWGLWMKAKSLNSTGHQQKSKAVDSKLRLTESKKNYPHFHGIALMCLAGAHPFALPHRILKQSQFLSCCLGAQHSSGHHEHITPCTLSPCVCNIHSPKSSFSLGCSAQTHLWIVWKCTKKMIRIICIYLMFSIVHLLHGFHIHAVLRGESFALCCKSYAPTPPSFLHSRLLPYVIIFSVGFLPGFPSP